MSTKYPSDYGYHEEKQAESSEIFIEKLDLIINLLERVLDAMKENIIFIEKDENNNEK